MKNCSYFSLGMKRLKGLNVLFGFFILTLFAFTGEVQAQPTSKHGRSINPNNKVAVYAKKIGISVAPFGTWDVTASKSVFQQKLNDIKPNSNDSKDRFRKAYYAMVLNDLNHSVAPEYTTIKSLMDVSNQIQSDDITPAFLKSLYLSSTSAL